MQKNPIIFAKKPCISKTYRRWEVGCCLDLSDICIYILVHVRKRALLSLQKSPISRICIDVGRWGVRLVRYLCIYMYICPQKSPIIFAKVSYMSNTYRRWEAKRLSDLSGICISIYMSANEPVVIFAK